MAMLQRLVVVLRRFRENLKAVSQELEKRVAMGKRLRSPRVMSSHICSWSRS